MRGVGSYEESLDILYCYRIPQGPRAQTLEPWGAGLRVGLCQASG